MLVTHRSVSDAIMARTNRGWHHKPGASVSIGPVLHGNLLRRILNCVGRSRRKSGRDPRMNSVSAVVLSSSKSGLAVVRALGSLKIPVICVWYGRTRFAASSRFARYASRSPDPNEDEASFVEFLLSKGDWWGGVLFPTDDATLLAVARNKIRLSNRYRVVSEDWAIVRQLLEKLDTYSLASRFGVPCPRVQKIGNSSRAAAFAREVGFPCLVKPSVSHSFFKRFGAKMILVRSEDELADCLGRLGPYAEDLMVSEYIPGDDTCGVNYNSFFVGGNPLSEFTAEKVRLKPVGIGFPTVVKSRKVPQVIEYGRTMLKALGYEGFSCMEFKRDCRDGVYKLMEINARHNFSGMLALHCGFNFPLLSYAAATGAELPAQPGEVPEDIFWIDEERDIAGFGHAVRAGLRSARHYADPYFRRPVFSVCSVKDPMPSLRQLVEALGFKVRERIRSPRDDPSRRAARYLKS